MPILLDDITSVSTTSKSLTPKFFSKTLTGSGKAVGLINDALRPGRYGTGQNAASLNAMHLNAKSKSSGSGVTTHHIPMGPLTINSINHNRQAGITLEFPQDDDRLHINEGRTKNTVDVHLSLTPQGITVIEDGSGDKMMREANVLYRMEAFVVPVGATPDRVELTSRPRGMGAVSFAPKDAFVMTEFSFAPLDDVTGLIEDATKGFSAGGNSVFVDQDSVAEWMAEFDLYERICRLADVWASNDIAEVISNHLKELFAKAKPGNEQLNTLVSQLRYLETYGVTLDAYREIHAGLQAHVPADIASTLAKQNLNLLMNSTLEDLETLKPQLSVPSQPQSAATPLPAHFSTQQRNAITTDEPLTLVTAGAGTGKSTVILARIEHLVSRGVDPKDVTVLSFTNAAADNIKAKNPAVGSMTISSMIHDIYHLNHPTHELSSIDTILNSLDIFYPNSELARAFRRHLMDMDKNQAGATTKLNVFVEMYYDELIAVLDTLRQTCLELEIIMAYQKIQTMTEPAHVRGKYLIIDEVQDNSIFEFIYTLKYTSKHHLNMFIVGDASQTLYAFRAANPRALNALEGSGVFITYQLTTNYRSNQEILDFANVHLADIEANQTAGLRLQANSLDAPTADSFKEKVTLSYDCVSKLADFTENYASRLRSSDVKAYIDDKVAKGEPVAFLMFTRAMAKTTEETLMQMYPGKKVANLVSDKVYGTTVFTMYIKQFWNDVLQVPDVSQAAFVVHKGVQDNLEVLTRNATKAMPAVQRLLNAWWLSSAHDINGWVALVHAGSITKEEFFYRLRDNLLTYEIAENRKKFTLTNERNRERKEKNLQSTADFVVSTIHGAKGLEFPNVVVVHKFDAAMEEENKRMYYVALTRAMKTELVLSYGTAKNARVESDYQLMVDALEKRDTVQALRDAGIDPDIASEDEITAALAKLEQDEQSSIQAADVPSQGTDQGVLTSDDTLADDEGDDEDDSSSDATRPAPPATVAV